MPVCVITTEASDPVIIGMQDADFTGSPTCWIFED